MLDRVEEIRDERIPPRVAQVRQIRQTAVEEFDEPWMIPDELEQRYQRLKTEIKNLNGEAETLEHYAEAWGDDTWKIRELSVGGVGMIQDDVAEASDADMRGGGTPAVGFSRTRTLEVAVVDGPTEAPDPADIPDSVGDWLYDCVDEFNTTGGVDLGNTSLREDLMKSADSSRS